jgi:hypothetical protein
MSDDTISTKMNFLGKDIEFLEVPYKEMKAFLDEKYLWKHNDRCPVCEKFIFGQIPEIRLRESGYSYCSDECVNMYIKAIEGK